MRSAARRRPRLRPMRELPLRDRRPASGPACASSSTESSTSEEGELEGGRAPSRIDAHPRADRLRADHEPSPGRQGGGDRAGRAHEHAGRQRAAEDAGGAAAGHATSCSSPISRGACCRRSAAAAASCRAPSPTARRRWRVARRAGRGRPRAVLAQAGGAPLRALELAAERCRTSARCGSCALARSRRAWAWSRWRRASDAGGARRAPRACSRQRIDWLLAWTADLARVAAGDGGAAEPGLRARARRALPAGWRPLPLFRYHDRLLRAARAARRIRCSHGSWPKRC